MIDHQQEFKDAMKLILIDFYERKISVNTDQELINTYKSFVTILYNIKLAREYVISVNLDSRCHEIMYEYDHRFNAEHNCELSILENSHNLLNQMIEEYIEEYNEDLPDLYGYCLHLCVMNYNIIMDVFELEDKILEKKLIQTLSQYQLEKQDQEDYCYSKLVLEYLNTIVDNNENDKKYICLSGIN